LLKVFPRVLKVAMKEVNQGPGIFQSIFDFRKMSRRCPTPVTLFRLFRQREHRRRSPKLSASRTVAELRMPR
jgi:hypothetical protein